MIFHVVNANVEWELEQKTPPLFPQSLFSHKNFLQLQFLPLLYAKADEKILVTHYPSGEIDPRLTLYQDVTPGLLESWGASFSIAKWAQAHQMEYRSFSPELLRTLHSKSFSFSHSPRLKGAQLLHDKEELFGWLTLPGEKVLKSCLGFSGRGHLLVKEKLHALHFCEQQWKHSLPVIGEPWVVRLLDFSTQWVLEEEITYLGETLMQNHPKGGFALICAGESFPFPDHLTAHKKHALKLLERVYKMGYRGHVGIDAMIYGNHELHPIVEMNPRKTFGYLAWFLHAKHKKKVSLQYGMTGENVLPSALVNGKQAPIQFPLRLSLRMY